MVMEQNIQVDLEGNYMKIYTKSLIDNGIVKYINPNNSENINNLINIQKIH